MNYTTPTLQVMKLTADVICASTGGLINGGQKQTEDTPGDITFD